MNKFKLGFGLTIALLTTLILTLGPCLAGQETGAPPELARWQKWVLHGKQGLLCPSDFDDQTSIRCQWPSRLIMIVDDQGAKFDQHWRLFADGWVHLPGNRSMWPEGVQADGKTLAVVERNGLPAVYLEAGSYRVTGRFYWLKKPEIIKIPAQLGLVDLVVDGKKVGHPVIDRHNNLWVTKKIAEDRFPKSALQIHVVRLVRDTIPMRLITLLKLDVSGPARKEILAPVLPMGALPMQVQSVLPARLNPEGRIEVQLRPGTWQIRLEARISRQVDSLEPPALPYGPEVWAFEARPKLRLVKVKGASLVEPTRTHLPQQWQRFPAYLLTKGRKLVFVQIRRGAAEPVPDRLELERDLWLDFRGTGFTAHDRISGRLSQQWYLTINSPAVLGRVSVGGRDRLITEHGPDGRPGVELRQGRLDLQADIRLESLLSSQSVNWWDHDFTRVHGRLHLPPGWQLLAVTGVDIPPQTWVNRWSLLDFFLVLIVSMAVFKLFGPRMAVLALLTMTLIYHEPGSPRLVWLHLLAAMAVRNKVGSGFFHRLAKLWIFGAFLVLAVQSVLFTVNQVRTGFFPQLAQVGTPVSYREAGPEPREMISGNLLRQRPASAPATKAARTLADQSKVQAPGQVADKVLDEYDPEALIPTGPGLPDWQWRIFPLKWNGPVRKDQVLHFYLVSPAVNLVLVLLRVALLALLILAVTKPGKFLSKLKPGIGIALVILVCGLLQGGSLQAAEKAEPCLYNGFPPAYLLDELEKRLLTPSECFPRCADLSRMDITLRDNRLQVLLQIHAAIDTAVPLPAARNQWMPEQVLADGAQLEALGCDMGGKLWAAIPAGRHTMALLADVTGLDAVRLPLSMKPHRTTVTAPGWKIEGLSPGGRASGALVFQRIVEDESSGRQESDRVLAPFFQVKKRLILGLDWKVSTTVERLTPAGQPVVLKVPLVDGESITTPAVATENGKAVVRMAATQRRAGFVSTLKKTSRLILQAPEAEPWTEIWTLDASPLWHFSFKGLSPIQHQDSRQLWRPKWMPWPGEKLIITVSRPKALTGTTVTIDNCRLDMRPSGRLLEAELDLILRSSKGGQHIVGLPEEASLQTVEKNGKILPLVQDGNLVVIPLDPGRQKVRLVWQQAYRWNLFLRSPQVDLGHEAVNARVNINMPSTRWVLWLAGPRMGPAVLFWSYLAACFLVALALGRTGFTILGVGQWMLLAIGLSQVPAAAAAVVVCWLLALGARQRSFPDKGSLKFDLLQVSLVLLTVAALGVLYWAIQQGLMASPEMQIAGNDSSATLLKWYQDRIDGHMPMPLVFSLPRWTYRVLMLLWSLWLAAALVGWLKWGWSCFSTGGMWRKVNFRLRGAKSGSEHGSTKDRQREKATGADGPV